MIKKTNNSYYYLTIGIVLLIIISFHYLTNFSTYWKQAATERVTKIGDATFVLLDYEQCANRCTDAFHCNNLYLFSVNSANHKAVYQFLKEFKPLNGCWTSILFQTDNTIQRDWKAALNAKPNEITFPASSFALGYTDVSGFSTVDLANGKANGKFRKYDVDGNLFIEQELVNNLAEGTRTIHFPDYKIVQEWQENNLLSEDTIK